MTTSQIIACTIAWAAAALAIWALIAVRRNTGRLRAEHSTAPEEGACSTYQPPATQADSGLCAGCGMYDYKHKEQS